MSDASDRDFARALEVALASDSGGGAPASPVQGELADLLATAGHVRRLQALPAPLGLAERLAARLALEPGGPRRPEPSAESPGPAPKPAVAPPGRTRAAVVLAALAALAILVWLAVREESGTSVAPSMPTVGATAIRPAATAIASVSASATHTPSATAGAAASARSTLGTALPQHRAVTRSATMTPTSTMLPPQPAAPDQEDPTARATATVRHSETPPPVTQTAVPTDTPVIVPSKTDLPPTSPPASPTFKPTEQRESTRTPTPGRDVSETPEIKPTEEPTRVVDPGRMPPGRR